MFLIGLVVLALLLSLGVRVSPAASDGRQCDPLLEQPAASPHGYRLRGDRCEGVYVQPVASTALLIASFTEVFEDYDLRSDRTLAIGWAAPATREVRLRASGLRRKLYYRMDTARAATPPSFEWPIDLLAALNIARPDLGVVGWTRQRIGDTERDVYVPLRITTSRAAGRPEAYSLVLLPGVQLAEVYVSLAAAGADGRPATFIRDEEPLRYHYYPADRPIDIPIPRPASPGLYYVLIGAVLNQGGSATAELWFHHVPR